MVTETKMFAHLRKGTKNAKDYDQAARTIACIAWAISRSNPLVNDFESLGFYVIAPHEQITRGIFSSQVSKSSIREKVKLRISVYLDDDKKYDELQMWYKDFFIPALEHIHIRRISWETMIDKVDNTSFRNFYNRCLRFNAQARS